VTADGQTAGTAFEIHVSKRVAEKRGHHRSQRLRDLEDPVQSYLWLQLFRLLWRLPKNVLTSLARNLKSGGIVFFDNFICSLDEFRASEEFVLSFRVQYEVLGAAGDYGRVCVKIL
jgi:hypothetical protein